MQLEKILKRKDGTQVLLTVYFTVTSFPDTVRWSYGVRYKKKNGRKWLNAMSTDDYYYRRLNNVERDEFRQNAYLTHVTPEEVFNAQIELYEQLKPVLSSETNAVV